jgi:hypothetical protein
VKAWTDMINMRSIPQNNKEIDRLKQFEGKTEEEQILRKKIMQKK